MPEFAKSRGRARLGPLDHPDRFRVSGDFCFDARNRGGVATRLRQRKRPPQQAKRRLRRAARAVPGCARHREHGIVRCFGLAQLRQPGRGLLAGQRVLAAQRTSEERRHRRPVGKALGKRQRVPPRAGIRQPLDRLAGEGPHGVGSRLTGIRVAQRPRDRRRRLAIHPTERRELLRDVCRIGAEQGQHGGGISVIEQTGPQYGCAELGGNLPKLARDLMADRRVRFLDALRCGTEAAAQRCAERQADAWVTAHQLRKAVAYRGEATRHRRRPAQSPSVARQ